MNILPTILMIALAGCMHCQPPPPQNALTGSVTIAPQNGAAGRPFVVRGPDFSHEKTKNRADRAYAHQAYDEAFGAYLAVCDSDHPDSCFLAAEILDQRLIHHAPPQLSDTAVASELYSMACIAGHSDACERVSVSK